MESTVQFPESFASRMQKQIGGSWSAFSAAHQQPAPTSIRVNPRKKSEYANLEQIPWVSCGRYLPSRPSFTLDPTLHGGAYYVQEASSMFLEQALKQHVDLTKSLVVLDLSAAPGGKSTHVVSLLSRESLLVSNEVIRSRANILSENIQKWGYENCIVTNNDPQDFSALPALFDVIIVDAPCSGEGLFRKTPEAMTEWSESNVDLCSSRQQRILHDIWPSLKPGGILVYSTCTYSPKENELNLTKFSQENALEFLSITTQPDWGFEEVRHMSVIGYQAMPHRVKGEGFFLSVMKKGASDVMHNKTRNNKKIIITPPKISARLQDWILNSDRFSFIQHNELHFAFPLDHLQTFELILQKLRVVYAGVNVSTTKHDKLIPEHALAVSVILNKDNFPKFDVTKDQALSYLRSETLMMASEKTGYTLITFEETPLGWVNALPNRMNNLYPSEWRIRM